MPGKFSSRQKARNLFAVAATLLLGLLATGMGVPGAASAQEVVYHINAPADFESYATRHNDSKNVTFSVVTDARNQKGLQVAVRPDASPEGYYNYLATSPTLLKGGQQYVATITFRVVTPTKLPNSFYMFFRNSAGNEHDLWQKWVDLPGGERTISFPVDLKAVSAAGGGDSPWIFYLGMKGPGTLVINSLTIASGTNNVVVTPKAGVAAKPAQTNIPQATGFTPFTVTPPAPPATTLSTADFHLVADGPAATASTPADNAAALQQAFNACKKGPTKLVIPKGSYRIAPTATILVNGINDLTVDGQGSTLVFEKLAKDGQGFMIGSCSRMRWENLALDWNYDVLPITSLGVVSNLSADGTQCDFTFPDQNAAQTELTRNAKWAGIIAMDPVKLVMIEDAQRPSPRADGKAATDKANVLHVTFPSTAHLVDGQTYCIRHLYYEMTAFKTLDSNNLAFDKVNIYAFPGMGWLYGGAVHHLAMTDCHVERGPHPRRALTLAADGIHADSSEGNLLIKDCSFTGLGDDSINLHDNCYQGSVVVDPADGKGLTLVKCPPYQLRLKPGDSVEFYNADYSPLDPARPTLREVATVAKAPNGQDLALKFTTAIPKGVTALSIVRNARLTTSNVCIEGCKFEYSNGRGVLFSSRDATIRNCNFLCSGTPIVFETEIVPGLWSEGSGAANILVEGNRFTNVTSRSRYGRAVIFAESLIPWGPTNTPLFRNLTIINNDFAACPGPAVSLDASAGVVVRGNRIDCTQRSTAATRYTGTVFATNSARLALGGNTWITDAPAAFTGGVVYDKVTTSSVFPDGNALVSPMQAR